MKSITSIWRFLLCSLCLAVFWPDHGAHAAASEEVPKAAPTDFTQLSLEELKDVVIVSVSRKPEMVSDVAAAVYVITKEAIRRSGVTSIPEALRLAPGVHVARITATDWAINIRGLNDQFAQDLLVMIDGRSVYTPVFSGVFWDIQDTVIEDIDRIEVIRGPGAALWGANAVNGVINIITKRASQTQGWQAVALLGSQEQSGSLRYGGTLGGGAYFRTYGKFFNRGDLDDVNFSDLKGLTGSTDALSSDDWQSGRGGFRMDMEPGQGLAETSLDSFTLQGEAYSNSYEKEVERRSIIFPSTPLTQTGVTDTSRATGWHLLGQWKHSLSPDSGTILQMYYDHNQKDYDPGSGQVHTGDIDFQHRLSPGQGHDIVWGLEYKFIADEFDDSLIVSMEPSQLNQSLWSSFIQDEMHVFDDRLTFIGGVKFEYNDFTGLEIQPSFKTLYTPQDTFSLWAAVSRAMRVPSRMELHGQTTDYITFDTLNPAVETEVKTYGNSELESEELIAYELGTRIKPTRSLWFDIAFFFNDYSKLIGLELGSEGMLDEGIDLGYANNRSGESYGLEMVADWKASSSWLLEASYTYLHTLIEEDKVEDPQIANLLALNGNPRHLFSLRSSLDITSQIDFDLWFRYVGRLPERDIDSYTVLDARLSWRPVSDVELSLVGQNLLENGHSEFSSLEVVRSIYGKIDWKF